MTGQVCLDRLDGPVHIQARRTNVKGDSGIPPTKFIHTRDNGESAAVRIDGEEYDVIPCPNQLQITDGFNVRDVFHTSPRDNKPSLSYDDRKFLQIMENGVTKKQVEIGRCHYPFAGKTPPCPTTRVRLYTD